MKTTLLALLLATTMALPADSRTRGSGHGGGHHGGGNSGGPTTEAPSTPSAPSPAAAPSAPNSPAEGVGALAGSNASSRTPGAYNNACATWPADAVLWQALWRSCK